MKFAQYLIVGHLVVCVTQLCVIDAAQNVNGALSVLSGHTRIGPLQRARTGTGVKITSISQKRIRTAAKTVKTRNVCPKGFASFRDSCFSLHLAPKSWVSARVACRGKVPGGDLASINSKEELDFIQTKFGNGKNKLSWIGLHKGHRGDPYTWANGDKVQYLPWISTYKAQEHAGYVALSLTNLHFLPKPSPHKMLPFLCGARSVFSTTRLAAGGVLDAGKHITKEYMDTQENPAEILNTCTEGWESFEGKCYKAFDGKMTHSDAAATCKKEGANLLSLHSPRESEFVRTHVMKEKRPGEHYWLGLSNDKNGLHWSDGSPFDYTNWLPGTTIKAQDRNIAQVEANRNFLEKCYKMGVSESMWEETEDADEICFLVCIKYGGSPPPSTPQTTTTEETTQKIRFKKPYYFNDEVISYNDFARFMRGVKFSPAVVPAFEAPSFPDSLNISDFVSSVQRLASADSVFDGASDQKPVTILVVLVGSVVLVVAAFGAISWRRRYGKFPYPWTSSYENNNHQSVRQSLRDPETVSVNQQVIYGAVE